jgi:hypothetical protein
MIGGRERRSRLSGEALGMSCIDFDFWQFFSLHCRSWRAMAGSVLREPSPTRLAIQYQTLLSFLTRMPERITPFFLRHEQDQTATFDFRRPLHLVDTT